VHEVLDNLVPKDIEVQTKADTWYQLHIRPYRTSENVIEGAVITFTDVTVMKKTQEALWQANSLKRLAVVVRDAYDPIIMQDLDGQIMAWNPAAEKLYGFGETEALKMNIRELIPAGQKTKELAIVKQLGRAEVLKPYATKRLTKDGRTVKVWLTATALVDEDGKIYAVATTQRANLNEE
jgi:two-component system CheB/CheR fusion protein